MTMRMMVVLDRQHAGKPGRGPGSGRPEDMGATMRRPPLPAWHEADLTLRYIEAARDALLLHDGIEVRIIDPLTNGPRLSYGARQEMAKWWARKDAGMLLDAPVPVVYVACHLNAGGGDYGMVGHDPRSSTGRDIARYVADQVEWRLPVSRCRVEALEGRWARGLSCIEGIYSGPANIAGILYEPLFLDHPRHTAAIEAEGLRWAGLALASGLLGWAEYRRVG